VERAYQVVRRIKVKAMPIFAAVFPMPKRGRRAKRGRGTKRGS
jgi:hypothetical protein